MAITVIKPEDMGYNFGGELGQSTGRGLKKIVDSLIQKKQQEHESEQQRQAFSGIGYSPEQINLLSQFDPETQFKILQTYKPQGMNQNQGQPQENELQQMLGSQQQGMPQENNIMQMFGGQQQQPQQDLNSPFSAQEGEAPFGTYQTPQMKLQRELAGAKEKSTQQRHIDKQNSKFNEGIDAKAESAERQQHALDVQKELDDTGQLDPAEYVTALKRFGLDYDVLLKPGTSLFKKMSATFLQDLKSVFPGGKITNQEMDAWLAGVPNISQTKEGRAQLYEVLGAANKAAAITQQVRDSIIERNGGNEPKNLRSMTLKQAKPAIDDLQKEVIDNIKKRSSRFETLPSPFSVPKGKVLTNHETKESKINTGGKWKTIPYRAKKKE